MGPGQLQEDVLQRRPLDEQLADPDAAGHELPVELLGGGAVESERLERIKAEQRAAAEDEERRIFYVACTRAKRLLVLTAA